MRWFVVVSGLFVLVAVGCDRVSLTEPSGLATDVSCLCAYCFNRDFCQNPRDPSDWEPPDADGCRNRWIRSERAVRLTPDGTETFFCIPPRDGIVLGTGGLCPTSDTERANVEFVDPCLDPPRCARDVDNPLFSECTDVDDTGVSCPGPLDEKYLTERTNLCIPSAGSTDDTTRQAREQAEDLCAHFHGDEIIPGDSPRRFCFTSCVAFSGIDNCDVALFDPPFVHSNGSILMEIGENPATGERATAVITVEGESGITEVTGTVVISAPNCDLDGICTASISWIDLQATSSLEFSGRTLSNIRLLNAVPLPDELAALGPNRSLLTIDPGGILYASGDVSGFGQAGGALSLDNLLTGVIDWEFGTFVLFANLSDPMGGTSIRLRLRGAVPGAPPTAHAGDDRTVQCTSPEGTDVTLTGSSTDRDSDVVSYTWSNGEGGAIAYEQEVTVTAPLGSSSFYLQATDSLGLSDVGRVDVEVVDEDGPVFGDIEVATDCLWAPNHSMSLFRLGTEVQAQAEDLCGGTQAQVRIVDVRSDQPADTTGDGATSPDVLFGDAAFCLRRERRGDARGRPRAYTITLEAEDAAGNVTRHETVVQVPHNQRPSNRCVTSDMAPVVDESDPRCTADIPVHAPVAAAASVIPDPGTPPPGPPSCSASPGAAPSSWWWALPALLLLRTRRSSATTRSTSRPSKDRQIE